MFLVNFVRLLLLVGVLYDSGIEAAGIRREQASDLRDTIITVIKTFCNYSQEQLNTEAAMDFFTPDATVLMDGFYPFVGHDEIRTVVEIFTEKAFRIDIDFKEVEPMDKDANLVYSTLHFDFFNEAGDKYVDASQLGIFKKTSDGYRFYRLMANKHNQSA